jgi:hypothetical protein
VKSEVADNKEFIFIVVDGLWVSISSAQFPIFARNSIEMKYDVKKEVLLPVKVNRDYRKVLVQS